MIAWGLVAFFFALASLHGLGWTVLFYPWCLSQALNYGGIRIQLGRAFVWGLAFEGVFYLWVASYGLIPWLALTFVRALPWVLYPLPRYALTALKASRWDLGLPREWNEALGGALGLGVVAWALLQGITGVDWETPVGALTCWPTLLRPLPWLGLVGMATLIGGLSHLLGSRRRSLTLLGVVLIVAWGILGLRANPSPSHHAPFRMALIQTGLTQSAKWDESQREHAAQSLIEATRVSAKAGAKLVIWPETAWPYRSMRRRVSQTQKLGRLARQSGVDILASSIEEIGEGGFAMWENTTSLIGANGAFLDHYSKRRLAPFAEYLPVPRNFEAALRTVPLFARVSHYVSGNDSPILTTSKGLRLGILICYESMVPGPARKLASDIDLFVVVTNDAPFGDQRANEAHFRSAILRAAESGKPVIQAANNGVTGVVAPGGTVISRTNLGFDRAIIQYWEP